MLESKNRRNISVFAKLVGGTYGGLVIFPILRKPKNSKERTIIKRANIAVALLWSLFIIATLFILLLPE